MNQHYKDKIMREMQIRGWTPKTQKFYMDGLKYFTQYFKGRRPTEITLDDIKNYILVLKNHRGQGPVWINMQIFSIRFFYKYVCKPTFDVRDIPKMKVPKRFPNVFTREEINSIINSTRSIKERAILTMIYSAGLRVNELVNLKLVDIDSNEMLIHVTRAKGNKQRFVPLSVKTLKLLRVYIKTLKYKSEWLFQGLRGEKMKMNDNCGIIFRRAKKSLEFVVQELVTHLDTALLVTT